MEGKAEKMFKDLGKKHVRCVAVPIPLARLGTQPSLARHHRQNLGVGDGKEIVTTGQGKKCEIVPKAAGVVEHVAESDRPIVLR